MSDKKILLGQGAISKNPPSEFTIEKLAKRLARLNPENGYNEDKNDFKEMIEDAIDTGELTIRGSPKFPLPGRCPDCHRIKSAPETIPRADAEQWCIKMDYVLGGTGKKRKKNKPNTEHKDDKPIHGNSQRARDQLDAAFYDFYESLIQGKSDPKKVEKLIKGTTEELTPHGLGDYLIKHHNAPSSAGITISEALKSAEKNDN